uniref:Enolase C-terminal domain-like n=1 Tax=Candidatus Kentrum sp. LFY TaxID=2126342 RepID=A0A450U7D3_9GAMM|nr:MAG: hypothetical protein BECKLFY1418B_GA0070995_100752 [Candidatus Kentron sp. LFY]
MGCLTGTDPGIGVGMVPDIAVCEEAALQWDFREDAIERCHGMRRVSKAGHGGDLPQPIHP